MEHHTQPFTCCFHIITRPQWMIIKSRKSINQQGQRKEKASWGKTAQQNPWTAVMRKGDGLSSEGNHILRSSQKWATDENGVRLALWALRLSPWRYQVQRKVGGKSSQTQGWKLATGGHLVYGMNSQPYAPGTPQQRTTDTCLTDLWKNGMAPKVWAFSTEMVHVPSTILKKRIPLHELYPRKREFIICYWPTLHIWTHGQGPPNT